MTMDSGGSSGGPSADAARASDDIKQAAHDAGDAVRSAAHDAKDKARQAGADKVDRASDGASASLRQVADQLKQAGQGLEQDQAWAGKAMLAGADGLERAAGYLSEGRFDDFARDLQTFARANPAAFLGGSVALGFIVARVAKTAAERAHSSPTAPTAMSPSPDPYEEPRSFDPPMDGGFGAREVM